MVGGAAIVSACLLLLGWTGEVVGLFTKEPETVRYRSHLGTRRTVADNRRQKREATIVIAVLCIYVVDFAINAGEYNTRFIAWEMSDK